MKALPMYTGLIWIVASLLAGGCSSKSGTGYDNAPLLSYSQLTNRLASTTNAILLDIRRDDEVARGMIPGAKHIPVEELRQRIHEIPTNSTVIVYCASGKRVPKALQLLKAAGCTSLYNFVSVTNWKGKLAMPR
ncbi:MAG TPA: rhodanese-like domain-containing protein [Spirochaetota bacterium]|nr:rhodanese-like domain-containing protein [Spirochaetota bacterium]